MIKAAISITRKINLLTTLLPFTKKPRKSIVTINRVLCMLFLKARTMTLQLVTHLLKMTAWCMIRMLTKKDIKFTSNRITTIQAFHFVLKMRLYQPK